MNPDLEQKVGRNLLLFQQAEHHLKALAMNAGTTATADEDIRENFVQKGRRIANETLGQVKNSVIESIYRSDDEEDLFAATPDHGCGVFFRISLGKSAANEFRQLLTEFVEARNAFVHRLYTRLALDAGSTPESMSLELDEQHDRFLPLVSRLELDSQALLSAKAQHASYLASDEGRDAMVACFVRQSPLVQRILRITDRITAPDGWASLGEAAREIKASDSNLIGDELERCERASISELLLASHLFELKPEPTASGGVRMLYRRLPLITDH